MTAGPPSWDRDLADSKSGRSSVASLRHHLQQALARARNGSSVPGVLRAARAAVQNQVLKSFLEVLPPRVLEVMASTGRAAEALDYVEAMQGGQRVSARAAVVRGFLNSGEPDAARETARSLCKELQAEATFDAEILGALMRAGLEAEARGFALAAWDRLRSSGEREWAMWTEVAQGLAETGLEAQAAQAAAAAVAVFRRSWSEGLVTDQADPADLLGLTQELAGLLGAAVGADGLEQLVQAARACGERGVQDNVLASLAAEFADVGEFARADELQEELLLGLGDSGHWEWYFEDRLWSVIRLLVSRSDAESLLVLTERVRVVGEDLESVRGACLVECGIGLYQLDLPHNALQVVREGMAAIRADFEADVDAALVDAAWLLALISTEPGCPPETLAEGLSIAGSLTADQDARSPSRVSALARVAGVLLDAGREAEAARVAVQAVEAAWQWALDWGGGCLFGYAAEALAAAGAGEAAANGDPQALAAMSFNEQDSALELLQCAHYRRLAGDQQGADQMAEAALAKAYVEQAEEEPFWDRGGTMAAAALKLARLGRKDLAERAADAAFAALTKEHYPCTPVWQTWEVLLDALALLGDVEGESRVALAAQEMESKLFPVERRVGCFSARLAESFGRAGEAGAVEQLAVFLRKYSMRDPAPLAVPAHLARGLSALGRVSEVQELLAEAVRLAAGRSIREAWDLVALIEAVADLGGPGWKELVESKDMFPAPRARIGEVLARVGEPVRALRMLCVALAGAKDPEELRAVLRSVFLALGTLGEVQAISRLVEGVAAVARLRPAA